MNTRLMLAVSACFSFVALVASADPAVDALFNKSRLHDVRITMAASDWAALRATYQENTNYDATLSFDGETIAGSTIRSRGSATRNGIKPGLRVDFNRKVKSQTFHGFKTLVVDNMYNDPSFVREQLAFSLFEEMGIRAPRESFARLTVNGDYWGVYAIVEPVDKIFVTNHVDGGQGNLFEYNVPVPIPIIPGQIQAWDFALSRGETIDAYVPSPFEPKTNEDSLDGSALTAFLRTISQAPSVTFTSDISRFIDPQALLTYYAVEVATAVAPAVTAAVADQRVRPQQLLSLSVPGNGPLPDHSVGPRFQLHEPGTEHLLRPRAQSPSAAVDRRSCPERVLPADADVDHEPVYEPGVDGTTDRCDGRADPRGGAGGYETTDRERSGDVVRRCRFAPANGGQLPRRGCDRATATYRSPARSRALTSKPCVFQYLAARWRAGVPPGGRMTTAPATEGKRSRPHACGKAILHNDIRSRELTSRIPRVFSVSPSRKSVSALGMTAGALAVRRRSLFARIRAIPVRANIISGTATHLMLAFLIVHDELLQSRICSRIEPVSR